MRFLPRKRRRDFLQESEKPLTLSCSEPGCDLHVQYEPDQHRVEFFQRRYQDWRGFKARTKVVVYLSCPRGHNNRYEIRRDADADA